MTIYGSSNIGMVRNDNQDSYLFDAPVDKFAYAVVCDGMGGPGGGKIASSIAVNRFSSAISQLHSTDSENTVKDTVKLAIDSANEDILSKASSDDGYAGMGTTLVSAVIIDKTGYFVNIGDSRVYLMRDDSIRRISHDHSAVQQLVDSGMLTESQARNHPNKNIITRALGVEKEAHFDFFTETLKSDDIIILCSDGITNYIDDLEISFETLRQKNLECVPQKLIELANSRGGADNSTVVLIKI